MMAQTLEGEGPWAHDEFGRASLGNAKRTRRLVNMANRAAERPGGTITSVFSSSAERQGAYKFVENLGVDHRDVGRAAHEATARRCSELDFVFVAVDGCTVSVTDSTGDKGFGKVGTKETRGRGAEVMNAVAVTPEGASLGMCGQVWWTRRDKPVSIPSRSRPLHQKETRHWLKCIADANAAFEAVGVTTPRWFQLDAGGDFRELLAWAIQAQQHVTVRAAQDRRVSGSYAKLWATVEATPVLGEITVKVPRGRKRKARTAVLELRSRQVRLLLPGMGDAALYAVLAREAGTTPDGESPIEWLLLTNMEAESFDDARLVVYGYTQRWRVEEFHKSWKSVCKVEENQLEVLAFLVWATILASVAMRVERLKYLARTTPDEPATAELSETEIDALLVLKNKHGKRSRAEAASEPPTISQAVLWIAELGGYTGKQSGGPPGTIVIGRGLRDVEIAARVLVNLSG